MIGPPGSANTRTKSTRRSASKVESPDEVIRQLQKLTANKKCADCSSKLPSCVNLTVGSFVCITCAGIHRELNQRVKGVGHSSFTEEEATRMKTMDNEKVNLIWLAKYNPRAERLQAPTDNSNPMQLKAWIRRKYYDKQWYVDPDGAATSPPPKNWQQQQQPPAQKNRQTSAHPKPTIAEIPPPSRQQQPVLDMFGDGAPSSQPLARAASDPFSSNDLAFPADFGSSQTRSSSQPDASATSNSNESNFATFPPPDQQQQGFATFPPAPPEQQKQPTQLNQSYPPPEHQMPQAFASVLPQNQFTPPEQLQPQAFATFPPQNHLPQPSQHLVHQNVPQPQVQQDFANMAPLSQQQEPQQQNSFASFAPSPSHQPKPPQQQKTSNHAPNFASFPSPCHGQASLGTLNSPTRLESQQQKPHQVQPGSTNQSQQSEPPSLPNIDHTHPPSASSQPDPLTKSEKVQLKEGQKVYYKTDGPAKIIKVHRDDELEPFYTIQLTNGKEKQTTDSNLHMENPIPSLLQNLIKKLSDAQVQTVYEFALVTLQNGEPNSADVSQPSNTKDTFSGLGNVFGTGPAIKNDPGASQSSKISNPQTTTPGQFIVHAPAAVTGDDDDPFAGLGPAANISSSQVLGGAPSDNNALSDTDRGVLPVNETASGALSSVHQGSSTKEVEAGDAQPDSTFEMMQPGQSSQGEHGSVTLLVQESSIKSPEQPAQGQIHAKQNMTAPQPHSMMQQQGQLPQMMYGNTQQQMTSGQLMAPNQMMHHTNAPIQGQLAQMQGTKQVQFMQGYPAQHLQIQPNMLQGQNQQQQNQLQHMQNQVPQQQQMMQQQQLQMMQGQGMQLKGPDQSSMNGQQQPFSQFVNSVNGGGSVGIRNGGYGGMPHNGGIVPQGPNMGSGYQSVQAQTQQSQQNPYQQQQTHLPGSYQQQPNQQGMYQQPGPTQGMYQQQNPSQNMYPQQPHSGVMNQQPTQTSDSFGTF